MTQPSLLTETWPEKAERLARELRDALPDPLTATRKQRERYAHIRYDLQCHIRDVP